ncbi:MAG: hypothetical protein KKD18_04585 [Nanoarchaeota archaeon]|nr:hypothetical protein [Nanoarchaeota archaeon]
MKKSGGYVLVILLALAVAGIITFTYLAFFWEEAPVMLAPPVIPEVLDCSPTTIAGIWDIIFQESAAGIKIVTNSSRTDTCEHFYAWKKKGNETFVMWGLSDKNGSTGVKISGLDNTLDYNGTLIFYSWGNDTDDVNETSLEMTSAEVGDVFSFMLTVGFYLGMPPLYSFEWGRSIVPEDVFSDKFKYDVENPFVLVEPFGYYSSLNGGYTSSGVFGTNKTKVINQSMAGYVHYKNQSAWYIDSRYVAVTCEPDYYCPLTWGGCNGTAQNRTCADQKNCWSNKLEERACGSACVPNWTEMNTTCSSSTESYTVWFRDMNDCNATAPANRTEYCDYNHNGIVGTVSDIDDVHLNIVYVKINGNYINYSGNYTGDKEVQLIENSSGNQVVRVAFDFDFDDGPLNFHKIKIERQSNNDGFGYLIVQGLEDVNDKEFRVDRVEGSYAICVKDRQIDDVSDIGANCDGDDEDYIVCPGTLGGYLCDTNVSGVFVVQGLDNSGVREMMGYSGPTGCQPNWSVGAWGNCINGTRRRTVTDMNNCPNSTGTSYVASESCTVQFEDCDSQWTCDDWFPSDEDCEPGEAQNQTCVDTNGCEDDLHKTKSCPTPEGGIDWLLVFLVAVAFLIVAVAVVLIVIVKRRRDREVGFDVKDPIKVLTRPPAGSYGGTHYGSSGGRYGGSYGGPYGRR